MSQCQNSVYEDGVWIVHEVNGSGRIWLSGFMPEEYQELSRTRVLL